MLVRGLLRIGQSIFLYPPTYHNFHAILPHIILKFEIQRIAAEFHKNQIFTLMGFLGCEDLKFQDSSKNVVFGVKMCPYRVLMDHCTNES